MKFSTNMPKIAYPFFQARKRIEDIKASKQTEDLPDLSCADVADAALKIQKVYRGFQTRKEIKSRNELEPAEESIRTRSVAIKDYSPASIQLP